MMLLKISFFIFPITAFAITPEALRENVIKNFPLIEEAIFKERAADGAVTSAEGAFDHKLKFKSRNRIEDKYDNQYFETTLERDTGLRGMNLVAGHRQGSGFFPLYDGKYDTSSAGEIFAGISLPLLRDSGTDEGRTNLALKKIEMLQATEDRKLKVNVSIHKALSVYYKWIAEDRILSINKEVLALAIQRDEMLRKRFLRGDVEKVKLTDNERTIAKRQAEVQKSEAKLRSIEASLGLFLDDLSSIAQLTDSELAVLIEPKFQGPISTNDLPPVRILLLEKEKSELIEKFADQSRLPGLGVDLIGARELSPGSAPYDPDRLQLAVRFDFPLENRKASGKAVESSYKKKAVERRLVYTERELRLNYENSVKLITIARERFLTTTSEAKKTRTMAQAEETRFRMGGSDLFVVNLRELDVTDAEIRRWTSWYEFHQAVLDAKLLRNEI
jgi:outer membrane protein TolC